MELGFPIRELGLIPNRELGFPNRELGFPNMEIGFPNTNSNRELCTRELGDSDTTISMRSGMDSAACRSHHWPRIKLKG